jgi:malonate decarboxylase beta subunit
MSRPAPQASHNSYLEATARERLRLVFDAGSFEEFLPPDQRLVSPHLGQLNAPVAFDDGVAIGRATLGGTEVLAAAQEGAFMGGAVGEVHGAKLAGLLRRAVRDNVAAVVLLLETGGVRLHEANAGLIAVSEVMRALLDVRQAGIPVVVLIGGSNGAFGGMGIVSRCANVVIMSEEGRLAMSGPEVIETANGVEEFDSRDRALVWRSTGGKHRYLLGDCQRIVADDVAAFRQAALEAITASRAQPVALTLEALEQEQEMLTRRIERFGAMRDPLEIWAALGIPEPEQVPMLEVDDFINAAAPCRLGAQP